MTETDDSKPKRIVIKPKSGAAEPAAATPGAQPTAATPAAAKPAEPKPPDAKPAAAAEDKPAAGLVNVSTLLTAVGGLIAALATLLTALNAAGVIGRPTATPVPPTATPTIVAVAPTATPPSTFTVAPTQPVAAVPSPTPAPPSPTFTPWLTLAPAATPAPVTPSASGGLMVDNFGDPNSGWDIVSNADYALAYVDGAYRMTVIKANNEVWSTHSGTAAMSDYVIEVDARRVAGPEDNDFGVVFRVQPGNTDFYQFRISSDGLYTLRRFQNDAWTDLQPWTESAVIGQGDATNRIRIEAIGPFLRCFVNSQMLAEAQDDVFAAGRVGLSAGTYDEGGVAIDFDNLRVVSLAPAGTAPAVGYRLYDDFGDPGTGWEITSSTDYATDYVDGAYRMVVYRPNYEIWSTDPRTEALTDHVIEVDARRIAGPEDNDFGVVFRVQPGNDEFYMFALSSDGFFTVQVREAGEWTDLQPWTKNAAILGGEATNRVRIEAIGPHMRFVVNGAVLTSIEDETFAGGRVGFSAGTFAEGGVQLEFDNLQIVSLYPF